MAFLVDDILLAPIKGIHFLSRKIYEQAQKEFYDEQGVRRELTELYMRLETGKITEDEFDRRENELVERLEEIQQLKKKGNSA